jgi:HlyD family secretion protein
MTKTARTGIMLGTVAVLGLIGVGLRGEALPVELVEARAAPLEVSFQEEGKTRLRQRYLVTAPVAGSVRRIELEPGDQVAAGQIVAQLEPTVTGLLDPASRARASAEASAAAAALDAARQRAAAARAAEGLARREHERVAAMPAESAISKSQIDTARTRALQARAELAAAIAEEQLAGQRQLAAAAVLAQEGRAGGDSTIALPAPIGGVVIKRFQESAGMVAPAQPLLEIGDPAEIEIEVEALSTDAVRLEPGMRARVLRWGGNAPLEATVTRIEPGGYTKVSALGVEEQRVRVILGFASPREQWADLGDAYRVEVEFVLWAGNAVLQVPSSALFREDGRWHLYVDDGGRAHKLAVEIGQRAALATQITAGLRAGQRVVAHPDDKMADGVRLKAI